MAEEEVNKVKVRVIEIEISEELVIGVAAQVVESLAPTVAQSMMSVVLEVVRGFSAGIGKVVPRPFATAADDPGGTGIPTGSDKSGGEGDQGGGGGQ